MTGEISDRSLHILYGVGRNGKSTLIDIIQKIIGTKYFVSCSDKVIMNKDNSSSTSPELVRLMGARLAILSETGKEEELNSTRIKSITGGDNIVARGLYQDEVQFKLQTTLAMLTNNKPTFDVKDQAMLDRIKLLPFLARFDNTPDNRDYINQIMTDCLDEFFSWFVDGAFEWYGGKQLVPCQLMAHEMNAYINELDIQGQFMEERIEIITKEVYGNLSKDDKFKSRTKKDSLFGIFVGYTMELGIRSKLSKSDFYKGLDKYNLELMKSNGIRYYLCKERTYRTEMEEEL
jgi:putative DNA primase/helicase